MNNNNNKQKTVNKTTNKTVYSDNNFSVEEIQSQPKTKPEKTISFSLNSKIMTEIKNKKLCLNMIVKNESKVIERMLSSVAPFIDCYCICDTGSTDNTIELIENFFKNYKECYIPGKIIKEPFQDFGYNRSFALKACDSLDVEYILLLDADMILQIKPNTTREELYTMLSNKEEDIFYIFQGSETFFYKNVRIIKNHKGFYYWGVTHEYVKTPDGTKYGKFDKNEIFINDIGDGGCKNDKFIRDIELLKKGLEREPNNDRYTFYLANSYRDGGQYDNAIDTYKKRIEIGGWFDEIWHSYYSIGKCYKNKDDMANAIYWWIEAYNFYPNRIENLYEIIHYYRCNGKNTIAYGFYIIAENERKKNSSTDFLFLQKDVYDYKLDYELSIIGYYCNYQNFDLKKCSMKVLNYPHLEEHIAKNVLSNYKFYVNSIASFGLSTSVNSSHEYNFSCLKLIGNNILEIQQSKPIFKSSTPSMCITNTGELVVNVRYVDYNINEKGDYENRGVISTKNVIAIFDISVPDKWELINEFVLDYDKSKDNLYVGLEDIRLFSLTNKSQIYFNANRGLDYHNIQIEHGIIDLETKSVVSNLLSIENQNQIEKNWVLFENSNKQMKIVYNWSPLVIGNIVNGSQFIKTDEINVPYFFRFLRGSTNGIKIDNEIWFVCHTVSYEDRRYYYHIIVVLDASTYKVKKYTPYFTFEKVKVEYTLGFVYLKSSSQLLFGYSLLDNQTEYMTINKGIIDNMMIMN
jgi:tetratricopeptide (TPR) repeat protein